ncbi:MAG: IPT/TIG domain-containing protein [Deltaproteobacteria bacterium]|nr:IPT/TIG domain-containing protein [Deltaproteobacteria bacterium]
MNFVPKVEVHATGESLKANATFTVTLSLDGGEVMRLVGPADGVVFERSTEIRWDLNPMFPAGVNLSVGHYDVEVIDPSGRRTNPVTLNVEEASALIPAPTITSIDPRCGLFSGGETVVIRGTNFIGATSVLFGAIQSADASVESTSVIRAVVPLVLADAGPTAAPNYVDLRVSAAGGTATFSGGHVYVAGASAISRVNVVDITGFLTGAIDNPDGGAKVLISGSSFTQGSVVYFGASAATVLGDVADGGTQVTVIAPPATVFLDDAGSAYVDLSVSGVCGTAVLDGGFRYYSGAGVGAPVLSSISPQTGPEIGGTLVEIRGANFDLSAPTTAYIGPNPLSNIVVDTPELLRGLTPPGSASDGPRPVTVITQKGSGQLSSAFTYEARPVVEVVVPSSGPKAGGIPVTIRGQGFIAGTGFSIGSTPVPAVSITTVDAGIYEARGFLPTAVAPGVVNVVAYNQNGLATLTGGFTYYSEDGGVPTVSSIAPVVGPMGGGTSVTVTGTNFVPSTIVQLGGVNLSDAGYVSSFVMTGFSPPAAVPGQVAVTAYTPNIGGMWDSGVRFTYNPVVSIASVSPAIGPMAGGTTVTIDGDGFVPNATLVYFDGVEAVGVVYELPSPTKKMSVYAPAMGSPGPVNITVVDDYGQAIAANAFTYVAPPTITTLVPASGTPSGGTFVAIFGTDLVDLESVKFDGLSAVLFWDAGAESGKIMAISPAFNDAGAVPVTLTALGGTSNAATFTYSGAPVSGPTVVSVEPATGMSAGGTSVRVFGAGFDAGMVVLFGGVPLQFPTFVNTNEIDGLTPAHSPGAVDVSVGGGTPLANAFTYLEAPTISSVVPSSGTELGGTSVTITGANFSAGAAVTFGGQPLLNVVVTGTTSMTGVTQVHAPGTVDVVVTAVGGSSSPYSGYTYTVASPGPATISNVSPLYGAEDGGTWVTVTGTKFDAGTAIYFGGVPMAISGPILPNQVTGFAPRGTGAVSVQVDPPVGGTWSPFTYLPPPHVSSIVPSTGPSSGGTPVTIYGTDFADAGGATLGGVPLTQFLVVNPTTITGVTASLSEGQQNVVVTNALFGSSPETVLFAVTPNFTVTSISPKAGSQDGGISITITGSSFSDAGFIAGWGSTTLVSSTTMSITIPAGQGTKVVSVTMGETKTCADASDCTFNYMPGPTLSGITPVLGPTAGGTSVEFTGANLASVTGVTFGSNPAGSFVYEPGTGKVFATTPAGPAGNAAVVLTTPYGMANAPTAFRYVAPPTITSVMNTGVTPNVNEGSASSPAPVTITGTNFVDASVSFDGGGLLSSIVVVNETTITATTPSGPGPGYVTATVSSAGGVGSLGNAFYYTVGPSVTGISPDAGPYAGGTAVSIIGSGFSPATTVRLHGVADGGTLLSKVFVNPTLITGTTPAASGAGSAPITAYNTTGSGTLAPGFAYDSSNDLAITSVTPSMGTVEGSVPVVIFGRNFGGVTSVLFDGGPVLSMFVVSGNQINVTTPASAYTGRVDVEVCKPGCDGGETYAILPSAFEYIPAVSITSIYPPVGPTISQRASPTNQHVTITGANFNPDAGLIVKFFRSDGSADLINQVIVNATTITGEVPNGISDYTTAEVSVTSPVTGTKILDAGYSYWPAKVNFASGVLNDDVFAIAEHTPTRMWVGTGNNGLVLIEPVTGAIIRSYVNETPSNKIRDVAVWKSGLMHRLVLATHDNGIEVCSVDAGSIDIVLPCTPYFTNRRSRGVSVHQDGRAYSATDNGIRAVDLYSGSTDCWSVASLFAVQNDTNGISVDTVNGAIWLGTQAGIWGTATIPAVSSCNNDRWPTSIAASQVVGTSGSVQAVRVDPDGGYLYSAINSSSGGMGRCMRTLTPDCQSFGVVANSPPFPSNCRTAQDVAIGTVGFAWLGVSCGDIASGFGRFNMSQNLFDSEWVSNATKKFRVNAVFVDSREVKWIGGTAGGANVPGVTRYTEW